jgi:gamma-glutamyltranspeptidase/glutathione hydrolase
MPRTTTGPGRTLRLLSVLVLAILPLTACTAGPDAADQTPVWEPMEFPPTNRPDVRGTSFAVSSDHPLATAAGFEILSRGGNAVDAAVATAAVLAVVRPHMNGVGGDVCALLLEASTGQVHALNGSGPAGALATPGFFADLELNEVPQTGPLAVSVPGAVDAWITALERFGTMSAAEVLAPAIGYARDGFPVSTRLAFDFETQSGALNETAQALYMPGGSPPPVGSLLKNPALAGTLERIARQGRDGFYRGPVAEAIGAFVEAEGGYLRASDLAGYRSEWVDPIRREHDGLGVHVMPPNTQGVAQLSLLGLTSAANLTSLAHNTAEYLHRLIELKKLAFADRDRWVADPAFSAVPVDAMLDPDYLAARAALVDDGAAAEAVESGIEGGGDEMALGTPATGPAAASTGRDLDDSGDTVYLTVVDADGNAVSWIQSLFAGFGSGLLEPETGVLLHNRGALFTLEDGHPNQIEPGKRPYHTLTPLLALDGENLAFTLGTPGGDGQVQSLTQIMNNLLAYGMTPQQAIEAPRFRSYGGTRVAIEDRVPPATLDALTALGHELRLVHGWTSTFGGAQMIRREPGTGTLTVASDPRREAYGLAR